LHACIEDPVVIKKILTYLEEKLPTRATLLLPDSRAPPQSSLFGYSARRLCVGNLAIGTVQFVVFS